MVYKIDALSDIVIGKELDSGTLDIVFDVSKWQNVYPELEHYRIEASAPNGLIYIPTEVKLEGNHLIWNITDADTAHDGKGAYQIVATGADGQRKTSDSRSLYIGKIIDGTDAADPPEPSKPWVDAVLDAAKRAEEAAERAESAGGGSVTPEQIGQAVEDYLTKNPVEVTETDPTVPAWAKEAEKPKYTADDVGAASKEEVDRLSEEKADKFTVGEGLQMNEGVLSAVGGGSANVYKLIETITIDTDDITTLRRTEEPDRTPYNYNGIIVKVEQQPYAEASGNCTIKVTLTGECTFDIVYPYNATYKSFGVLAVEYKNGRYFADSAASLAYATNMNVQHYRPATLPGYYAGKVIKDLHIRPNTPHFVSGTKIEIWAVRA